MATLGDEVLALSAVELASKLAQGELSSEEVTSAYLDRIEQRNGELNAFVTYGRRRALFAARHHDKQRRSLDRLPPFWGVPTGIKDLHFTREFPTRFGSRGMRLPYLPIDDRLTQQVRAAGFVVVGKLATSEVGALPVTEPLTHGPTITPWRDIDGNPRSAGGSSGGSGAAVAGGLVPIAPGSDGAGSVRIPAAFNGLVGIKPSRGRIRNAFGLPDKTILYSDGPLARSVLDAAHLLDALAGISVGKPTATPPPTTKTFAAAVAQAPKRLRIHVSYQHDLAATDPAIVTAIKWVVALLGGAGHDVHELPWLAIELNEFLPVWQRAMAESRVFVGGPGLTPPVAWLTRTGRPISKAFAEARKADLAQRIAQWFGDADIWISPTVMCVAPRLGLGGGPDGEAAFRRTAPIGGFTAPFNVTGQPALSLPIGCSPEGLPMAVQLAGRMFDEATLISVAAMLEAAMPPMPRYPAPAATTGSDLAK